MGFHPTFTALFSYEGVAVRGRVSLCFATQERPNHSMEPTRQVDAPNLGEPSAVSLQARIRESRLSNTTCLTRAFFKSGE